MTEIAITIAQYLWRICFLIPAVMLIVLKRKKKASVRTFFKGMALSFLLNMLAFAGLIFTNEDKLTLFVYPVAMVIGFVLFYCVYHEDDTPDTARSWALGAAQFTLLFWGVICICALGIWRSDPWIEITDEDISAPLEIIAISLTKTAVAVLGIFGTYKVYSSEKLSGRSKVLLSSLFSTLICFGVIIIWYIIQ